MNTKKREKKTHGRGKNCTDIPGLMWVRYHSHRLDIRYQKGAAYRKCHRISQCSVFWACAHHMCPVHSQCLHNHCLASHWWSCVISASQFEHLDFLELTGVKTSGAGEGRPFRQGEIEEGELTWRGGLLRCSGDSNSLSNT